MPWHNTAFKLRSIWLITNGYVSSMKDYTNDEGAAEAAPFASLRHHHFFHLLEVNIIITLKVA
ncbi:hypothetical protein [Paenibacillus periandrae]|uniref:hypothetical protein n=1 Tax=Paenibacillus periandrae TaxID=1761741 RepID=UPI001F095429|nr:hypothetical protein [Paenibacillus periandrae]